MNLFGKKNYISLEKPETRRPERRMKSKEPSIPDGMWIKCNSCKNIIYKKEVTKYKLCPNCEAHFRMSPKERIAITCDEGTFEEFDAAMHPKNPMGYPDYDKVIEKAQKKAQITEGVVTGRCQIEGHDTVIAIMDSHFMMGSMGSVVGEKVTRAVEYATAHELPIIIFTTSGGARMQEGIVSLMQMAKTSAALKRHSEAGLLYIPVLTDPTTGGVTASFAMLGDIILAEPGALIGFAGPRVIEQTIGEKLPEGFQRAQFQLEHGFVDRIVERKELKLTLYRILKLHHKKEGYANFDPVREADCLEATELMKERATKAKALSAWEKVKAARKVDRLASVDYIEQIFDEFMELHGDRQFRDDPAIVGGVAYLDGQPVTVIGVHKGKDLKECMHRNYGMPSPEGYRKALRLMKQAEKFKRPVITFVNTSGAFCGMEAEERGQGEAIARNLYEMSGLKVPVLCIMIGEGGSGGALALSVGNEVWMLENATYSILSPEGFASILWKDGRRAKEASGVMKITAQDLKALGVIEEIIPEYGMADQPALISISRYMKRHIKTFLKKQNGKTGDQIAAERYQRFRVF